MCGVGVGEGAHTMKGDYWCPPTPPARVNIYHVDVLHTVVWRGIQSYDGSVRESYTLWKRVNSIGEWYTALGEAVLKSH